MLKEKDYCDYDTCVALKELGYDDVTHYYFNKEGVRTPRIPLYEAQKWLREEKDIIVYPEKNSFGWYYAIHYNVGKVHQFKYSEEYETYEEALLEGIKEAVKILKENETILR